MPTSHYRIVKLSLIFLILCFNDTFSQENSINESYYLSPFIINPAITGSNYYRCAEFSAKKQWLGFTDAPETFLAAFNIKLGNYDFYDPKGFVNKGPLKLKERVGVGGLLCHDVNGPISSTGLLVSYAYHLPVNQDSRLSFGLSASGNYYAFNEALLNPDQPVDPFLLTNNNDVFKVNFDLGAYFYDTDYFLGISAHKILPENKYNTAVKEHPTIYFMGGHKFYKDYKSIIFEPSVVFKLLNLENPEIDIHTKLYIKMVNWVALSYSTAGKANFRFALKLYKMLGVGYNFEFSTGGIAPYNYGSHELVIGFNLGLSNIEGIRTTREYSKTN